MNSALSQNYFELFGLPETFTVSQEQLVDQYRKLQQATHPDKYASASDQERRLSVQQAAKINEAFHTLKDSLARARYLLKLRGVEWDDETETSMDAGFLMEQMELREALSEARDKDDPLAEVGNILDHVTDRIHFQVDRLHTIFSDDRQDLEQAKDAVRKLQFLYKLRSEAESLEAQLEDEL